MHIFPNPVTYSYIATNVTLHKNTLKLQLAILRTGTNTRVIEGQVFKVKQIFFLIKFI